MNETEGSRFRFPEVSGSNLEGQKFNLPKDFEDNLNIVVVAFRREQTIQMESWALTLEQIEKQRADVRYYELPVLSRAYSPLRWWIDGGMRAGISSPEARSRTITVYTAKSIFKNKLGIPNEETIYIFLVAQSGEILWQTSGEYTQKKKDQLQHTLEKYG